MVRGILVMRGNNGDIVGVITPRNGKYYTEKEVDRWIKKGYSFILTDDKYPIKSNF